eukprot:scaffold2776_cov365-Prasinococcus_capsulatus_cf.AAC.1
MSAIPAAATSLATPPASAPRARRPQPCRARLLPASSVSRASLGVRASRKESQLPGRHARPSLKVYASTDVTEAAPSEAPQGPPPSAPVKQIEDIRATQIAADVTQFRGLTKEHLKYEIEYSLKRGSSDNTYFIAAAQPTLVDVVDQEYADAFIALLKKEGILNKLAVIVLGACGPKRAKTLEKLLVARSESAPKLTIVCSNVAARNVPEFLPKELLPKFETSAVKQGGKAEYDIGGGRKLSFVATPTPRWPDLMMTYDASTGLLFSSKFFSAHIYSETVNDEGGFRAFNEDWRFYFDCMLAPAAKQTQNALKKLDLSVAPEPLKSYTTAKGIDILKSDVALVKGFFTKLMGKTPAPEAKGFSPSSSEDSTTTIKGLCPLHGPIVEASAAELIREYGDWVGARLRDAERTSAVVLYASAYGNTAALAQAIAKGVCKAGVGVESINCEFTAGKEIVEAVEKADGFVIGSPTLGGHMPTPVQEALGAILAESSTRKKPCGVFGSFGWSGEAVDEIEKRLTDAGYPFAFDAIRCKFKPTDKTLQICEESGTDLGQAIRKNRAKENRKLAKGSFQPTTSNTTAQAVGRLVGTLCVVTAEDGTDEDKVSSGMLASWVSQASFTPPGITVAVAKVTGSIATPGRSTASDRAVESLLMRGNSFNINVLGEGGAREVSKAMLKPFKPGEDRFEGLDIKKVGCYPTRRTDGFVLSGQSFTWLHVVLAQSSNGCVVLPGINAYLECKVSDKIETGDHWIVYATVEHGELEDANMLTAMHHRKSGATY